ncbi:hypothetical protein H6G91_36770 [Nostoc muscorum FACHB-395]|nr:hypothetical protein [Desmonostoc muscorum FACHB-395]
MLNSTLIQARQYLDAFALVADPAQTLDQWLTAQSIDLFACKVVRQQSYGMYTADPEAIGVGFFAYRGTSGDRLRRALAPSQSANSRVEWMA